LSVHVIEGVTQQIESALAHMAWVAIQLHSHRSDGAPDGGAIPRGNPNQHVNCPEVADM
jgi:hypothetical protein